MKEIEVKDCNDCPFCGMGGWEGEYNVCNLRKVARRIEPKGVINFKNPIPHPKWCPLKKESVLIKINK